MASSEIIEGLRNCELFALLDEEEIQRLVTSLATACEVEAYEAGGTYLSKVSIVPDFI